MKTWISCLVAGLIGVAALRADDAAPTTIENSGPTDSQPDPQGTATITTFHDNVVGVTADLRITCDLLQLVVDKQGAPTAGSSPSGSFKSMLATGHVHIYRGTEIVTCGRAEISQNENKVVLTDNPVLSRTDDGSSTTPGPHGQIVYYRGRGEADFLPAPGERQKTVLPTLKDLGLGTPAKPPAPPAPTPAK
jgi:hypothetical protein